MAHPEIRKQAQVDKSQQGVWESVARAATGLAAASPTQDYTHVLNSSAAKQRVEEVAASIEGEYERELRDQIRGRSTVGVVVAINGQLVWADVFSSPDLFRKYWPKLLRSYVMEAESRGWGFAGPAPGRKIFVVPGVKQAESFLLEDRGRVNIKMEPGAYRRTEISSADYQIVALEALGKSEDSGLLIHYNKMEQG
jgi:hypothetical protein